jgi:hypothetical protein
LPGVAALAAGLPLAGAGGILRARFTATLFRAALTGEFTLRELAQVAIAAALAARLLG